MRPERLEVLAVVARLLSELSASGRGRRLPRLDESGRQGVRDVPHAVLVLPREQDLPDGVSATVIAKSLSSM